MCPCRVGREVESCNLPQISGVVYQGPVPSVKVAKALRKKVRQGWVVIRRARKLESVKNRKV